MNPTTPPLDRFESDGDEDYYGEVFDGVDVSVFCVIVTQNSTDGNLDMENYNSDYSYVSSEGSE